MKITLISSPLLEVEDWNKAEFIIELKDIDVRQRYTLKQIEFEIRGKEKRMKKTKNKAEKDKIEEQIKSLYTISNKLSEVVKELKVKKEKGIKRAEKLNARIEEKEKEKQDTELALRKREEKLNKIKAGKIRERKGEGKSLDADINVLMQDLKEQKEKVRKLRQKANKLIRG